MTESCGPKVCQEGGSGLILPLFGDAEQRWPGALRAILYFFGLLWTFMGVAIVADVFMGAIERITSRKTRVWSATRERYVTVSVWNDTVANLTLMALGSSAPEILLGLIELLGDGFHAGQLGPSTIVGSAAFNLFCIIAVCVSVIPDGQIRKINDLGVYAVTVFFSLFAYVWLYAIVAIFSEGIIDVAEGLLTLVFFPVLVALAFMADKGYFSFGSNESFGHANTDCPDAMEMTPQEIAELEMKAQMEHEGKLTEEQVAKFIEESRHMNSKSRAHYRVGAIRNISAARRITMKMNTETDLSKVVPVWDAIAEEPKGIGNSSAATTVVLAFTSSKFVVAEVIGTLAIPVEMAILGEKAELSNVVTVNYKTRDGTAKAKSDYEHLEGTLEFFPGDSKQIINVKIMDDDAFEDDEEFYVDLFQPHTDEADCEVVLGDYTTTTVKIVDDDRPGIVGFQQDFLTCYEGTAEVVVPVIVVRKGGCVGKISVQYRTEDDTALGGLDYEQASGTLEFASGQASAEIPLTIKPRGRYDKTDQLRMVLSEPSYGARLDKTADGGENQNIMTIAISSNGTKKDTVDKILHLVQHNWERHRLGHSNWRDQFVEAMFVNGGNELEEGEEHPGCMEWTLHIINVPWKLLFACIPPSDFCNGWLCFYFALLMIGLVTAFINDLASLLGCVLGVPDPITAITFVALGTSLPDTFASKAAAQQDPHADASVGNVTGSNSVNVFLGIGLSWGVGAIYWKIQGYTKEWAALYPEAAIKYPDGGVFVVQGGDLGFSVLVFSICAVLCLSVLAARRQAFGGELGGPQPWKHLTSALFVFLWFTYVGVSAWKVLSSQSSSSC
eukprot:TRINITY_DN100724_c0_g1_i1.p1 TRINITY_DN100724_c0_g1~~TRINITY_DN100724_c0_g1_i1.p1  ORF type:complete len:840 (-),score=144.96 TRINITY_DN100724_c0_g1_i1:256-2775(-)